MKSPQHQRNIGNAIVNKQTQYSLMGYFVALAVLSSVLSYFTVRWGYNSLFQSLDLNRTTISGPELYSILESQKSSSQCIALFAILESSLVFLLVGALLSHRIAGPLYRIQRGLEEIVEGKVPRKIIFRKHDFFIGFDQLFNRAIQRLEQGPLSPNPSAASTPTAPPLESETP